MYDMLHIFNMFINFLISSFRPLQRMVVGMLLAGLAFAVAGIIQLRLQSVQSTLKIGESKLIIYNSAEFPIDYNIEGHYSNKTLNSGGVSYLFENCMYFTFYAIVV